MNDDHFATSVSNDKWNGKYWNDLNNESNGVIEKVMS